MVRAMRWLGWTLLVSGVVVLLYVVYLLWFTGLETRRAQNELADSFPGMAVAVADEADPTRPARTILPSHGAASEDADDDGAASGEADDGAASGEADDGAASGEADHEAAGDGGEESVDPGEAYAALWFERDGERIVREDVLYVVEGVTIEQLRAGPGHYPTTDPPGSAGNFAVAGHRTTYGSPFWSLNELRDGDTIHVVDREGTEWVYDYREKRVVVPGATWVVGEDPLETDAPTITLTTCHPRGSAARRLVVFGELNGEPRPEETR